MTKRPFKIDKGLRILKGKVKTYKVFGFDTETCNNNKDFVCSSIVGTLYTKFFTDKKSMIEELQTNRIFRGSFLVATNLMFDFFSLFGIREAIKQFMVVERAGSLIFCKTYVSYDAKDKSFIHPDRVKEDKEKYADTYALTFIDSGSHLRTSVANLGKIIKIPKLESPDTLGVKQWKDMTTEEREIMKIYNIQDSKITYKFMDFLQNHYNDLGANLKVTVSASSLDLFRRSFLGKFWKQEPKSDIDFCYQAYYGGRAEAFKRGCFSSDNYGKINVYDINSLYPDRLRNCEYPDTQKSYFTKKVKSEEVESFHGVCYVELKAPKGLNIPLLPLKSFKLLFPVGKLKGYYDFFSIRQALNIGYEIIKLGEGIIYPNTFKPFKSMIDKLYKLRTKLKKRGDMSQIAVKLLMNSFYGKLGFKYMNKENLTHVEDISEEDLYTASLFPTKDSKIYRVMKGENASIPNYVFPIIPLMVTSYSRFKMFQEFKKTGFERVFYSDTDCIFTNRKLASSTELGELKLEEQFEELIIVKPKFYGGTLKDGNIIKVKGLHNAIKEYRDFKDMISKNDFKAKRTHFRKLRSSIGATNKWVNQTYEMTKEMGLNDDKRVWDKDIFTLEPQNSNPYIS